VREESHLDEMRAAIKGDRERAAKRVVPVLTQPPPAPAPVGMLERLRRFLLGR
jgi:hypothetical protein